MLFLSVFLIALIFSMFGLGGGLFYMPVFMLFFDDPQKAAFLSFLCILVTAGSSAFKYYKLRNIDWRLVFFLGIPLIVMVFVSGFVGDFFNKRWIMCILSGTLILAGFSLMMPVRILDFLSRISRFLHKILPCKNFSFHPLIASPLAACVGFFCGISGVAGGVFEVPMMVGFLRVSPHLAIGTSSVIVFLSGVFGVMSRFSFLTREFNVEPITLVGILIAVFAGAYTGPSLVVRINKRILKKVFGAFIVLIGLYYIFRVIF